MKIRVLPYQPHCFAFGGFEIQMLSTLAAVQDLGIDAQAMDPWSRDGDFEILHVWGLGAMHQPSLYWAHRAGKRLVMTALLPDNTIKTRLRHLASSRYGAERAKQEMLALIDKLVVVSDEQAESAHSIYGLSERKISVIPNVVGAKYFGGSQRSSEPPVELRDYILTVGNICPRKNQLRLAEACVQTNAPLLIVGAVLSGEERYAEALASAIHGHPSIVWRRGLPSESDALIAAYQHCIAFALPGFVETQPISALEASVMRKPLILGDRPYARQKYYRNALRADPGSVDAIKSAIEKVREMPGRYVAPTDFGEECRADRVGRAYQRVFEDVMEGRK